jgi:hypothetical protein
VIGWRDSKRKTNQPGRCRLKLSLWVIPAKPINGWRAWARVTMWIFLFLPRAIKTRR